MTLLRLLNQAIAMVAAAIRNRHRHRLLSLIASYSLRSDDDLAAELVELQQHAEGGKRRQDDRIVHALAVAAVIFERHPCDLPPGSVAYPEQLDAALLLTRGVNVQMDTGEGKTYVVALAAVALHVVHRHVVVLTANGYLADRDLRRVRPFLDAAGVAGRRGWPGASSGPSVSYDTLVDLSHGYLRATYSGEVSDYPRNAAVIVDELDSVVIDQGGLQAIVRTVDTTMEEWSAVHGVVTDWGDDHFAFDLMSRDVVLSARAWQEITELAGDIGRPVSVLLEMARALAWASLAVEGREYLITEGAVRLVDSATGLDHESSSPRAGAIAYLRDRRPPPMALELARFSGRLLLRRHPFVVGSSGTLLDEALHFLQVFGSWTTSVPPRFARVHEPVIARLFLDRHDAIAHLAGRAASTGRPVVVGTRSVEEANHAADLLRTALAGSAVRVQVLTSYDSIASEEVVIRAGEANTVTVITQAGSRGIDIRSDLRPLLVVIGIGREPRLDRQFLGRVGRHGEAFDAEFVIDPQCQIWPVLRSATPFLSTLADGAPLPPSAQKAIARFQRATLLYDLQHRQRQSSLDVADDAIERAVAALFQDLSRSIRDEVPSEFARQFASSLAAQLDKDPEAATTALSSLPGMAEQPAAITADDVPGQVARLLWERIDGAFDARARQDSSDNELISLLQRTTESDLSLQMVYGADEISSAVAWARAQVDDPLFPGRAALLASYRLSSPSASSVRTPPAILMETLLDWHARFLADRKRNVDVVRVSTDSGTFHRKAAFVSEAAWARAQAELPSAIALSALLVDSPSDLDAIFFAREHAISGPATAPDKSASDASDAPSGHGSITQPFGTTRDWRAWVAAFLEQGETRLPASDADAVLTSFCDYVFNGVKLLSAQGLADHIDRFLDVLRARGTERRFMAAGRRLVYDFLDFLADGGMIEVRARRKGRLRTGLRRVQRYLRTIPRAGLLVLLCEAALLAAGLFVYGPVDPPTDVLRGASQLFGAAAHFEGRPLVPALAAAVLAFLTLRALGGAAELSLMSPALASIAALVAVAAAISAHAAVLQTIGLGLLAVLWIMFLCSVDRLSSALVTSNPLLLAPAASSLWFACDLVDAGHAALLVVVGVGVVAARIAGPRLAVSVGSVAHGHGEAVSLEEFTVGRRLPIDGLGRSATIGFLLTAPVFGLDDRLGLLVMPAVDVAATALQARARLDVEKVERSLARIGVGTAMSHEELRRWLRRQRLLFPLSRLALVALGAAATARAGGTIVDLLLLQLAGQVLLDVSASLLRVASPVSPSGLVLDDPQRLQKQPLRARLLDLRGRLRSLGAVAVGVVLYRLLSTVADLRDVLELVDDIWDELFAFFT